MAGLLIRSLVLTQVEFTAERKLRLLLYNSISPSASLTRTDRNRHSDSLTAQTRHHHTVIQTRYCLRCRKLSCSFETFIQTRYCLRSWKLSCSFETFIQTRYCLRCWQLSCSFETFIQTRYCLRCWKLSCSFETFNLLCASKINNTHTPTAFVSYPTVVRLIAWLLLFLYIFFKVDAKQIMAAAAHLKNS